MCVAGIVLLLTESLYQIFYFLIYLWYILCSVHFKMIHQSITKLDDMIKVFHLGVGPEIVGALCELKNDGLFFNLTAKLWQCACQYTFFMFICEKIRKIFYKIIFHLNFQNKVLKNITQFTTQILII